MKGFTLHFLFILLKIINKIAIKTIVKINSVIAKSLVIRLIEVLNYISCLLDNLL